jgi:hypothetical protein
VSRQVRVYGGAVSPRGSDNPDAARKTHSPTTFIRDLGAAYRASGRTAPIMDAFAFHPYMQNSSQSPLLQHPRNSTVSINDYGKLAALLGEAFDGTAQRGSTLPVLYDEFGVESTIPARKAKLYTGTEPSTTKPSPEARQATLYTQAVELAFCQPNVEGIFLFHTLDEPALDRWQSGVYYADGTPKTSLAPIRTAFAEVRRGVIARCPGLRLPVRATRISFPAASALIGGTTQVVRFVCDLDCRYLVRLERLPSRTPVLAVAGAARGAAAARARVRATALRPGRYRLTLRVVASVNPGAARTTVSRAFTVR